jgi:hypothetical protein
VNCSVEWDKCTYAVPVLNSSYSYRGACSVTDTLSVTAIEHSSTNDTAEDTTLLIMNQGFLRFNVQDVSQVKLNRHVNTGILRETTFDKFVFHSQHSLHK